MIMAYFKDKLINANNAKKSDNFSCPVCKEKVVLKKGTIMSPHFSHQKNSNCITLIEEGETEEHLLGKQQLYFFTRSNKTLVENYLPKIKQRPDLLYKNLAIEFQCSPININKLEHRIHGYEKQQIKSLWILGSRYKKRFGQPSTNKFYYYFKKLGFTMFFWLTSKNKLEIRYNCRYVYGKIKYQKIEVSSLHELIQFLNNPGMISHDPINIHSLLEEMRKLQNQLFYQNKKALELQNNCYLHGHNINGAPVECHYSHTSNPVLGKEYLVWKITLLNELEDGINYKELLDKTNEICKLKVHYPLINTPQKFILKEYANLLSILSKKGYIRIIGDRIQIIKSLNWFDDYYQKIQKISQCEGAFVDRI